jgi:hypothetical protein
MDVGVMLQLLIPTVEHGEKADLSAQMAGIASHFEQGLRAGLEQQSINDPLVLQGQWGEPTRKSKDHVDVGGRQKVATARLQPLVAGVGLALGTVPIAAGVERDGAIPAAGAAVAMPAQGGGAAALDGGQHFEMTPADPPPAAFHKLRSRYPDEIGHLQRRPIHLGVSEVRVAVYRSRQRQRVQGTRGGAEVAMGKVDIEGGLLQIVMTKQHLDGAQVRTRLVEMGGETVAPISSET